MDRCRERERDTERLVDGEINFLQPRKREREREREREIDYFI